MEIGIKRHWVDGIAARLPHVGHHDVTARSISIKQFACKLRVLLQIQRGLFFQYGWLRSWWADRPMDADGNPLPWITYPAIRFISQFDFSNASVFEWGSGFSTLWWAGRCKQITSVESDPLWVPYIRELLPESAELIMTSKDVDAEIKAFTDNRNSTLWDVIIIDNNAPFRWRCAEVAAEKLSEGGLIILDNSDQCLKACEVLRKRGLIQIDFTGFCPGAGYAHSTSIFFRGPLKFPVYADQPSRGPAQPNAPWPNC